jgi:hypothetical protein
LIIQGKGVALIFAKISEGLWLSGKIARGLGVLLFRV